MIKVNHQPVFRGAVTPQTFNEATATEEDIRVMKTFYPQYLSNENRILNVICQTAQRDTYWKGNRIDVEDLSRIELNMINTSMTNDDPCFITLEWKIPNNFITIGTTTSKGMFPRRTIFNVKKVESWEKNKMYFFRKSGKNIYDIWVKPEPGEYV